VKTSRTNDLDYPILYLNTKAPAEVAPGTVLLEIGALFVTGSGAVITTWSLQSIWIFPVKVC